MSPRTHPDADILDPAVMQDVANGELRLTPQQALRLYHDMPQQELARWADARCRTLHGEHIRTYVIDRNINYTNVCTAKCTFCAFRRDGDEDDAYTLEYDELLDKIQELVEIGGTQILMQGGMNPDLPLGWYLDLLRADQGPLPAGARARVQPAGVHRVHPLLRSARRRTLEDKLRWRDDADEDAGLDSIPGGGGEIFAAARAAQDRARQVRRRGLAHDDARRPRAGHEHVGDDDVRPHRGDRRSHSSHGSRPTVAGSRDQRSRAEWRRAISRVHLLAVPA